MLKRRGGGANESVQAPVLQIARSVTKAAPIHNELLLVACQMRLSSNEAIFDWTPKRFISTGLKTKRDFGSASQE